MNSNSSNNNNSSIITSILYKFVSKSDLMKKPFKNLTINKKKKLSKSYWKSIIMKYKNEKKNQRILRVLIKDLKINVNLQFKLKSL